MYTFTKWLVVPMLAAGLFLVAAPSKAEAQFGLYTGRGLSITIGGGGYNTYRPSYGYGHSYHSGHGFARAPGFPIYGSTYSSGYRGRTLNGYHGGYHGTGHYDYHPPQVIRHGNHFDVLPGHYDYHRSGHYHH